MSKKPYVKKSQNKKKTIHTTHPYLEVVQEEITSLGQKLHTIEENEAKNELTNEEQTEKTMTKACLERYQATLAKLTDSATESKVKSYSHSQQHKTREALEKQVLDLLIFFYIMRLGQCGLFEQIKDTNENMLATISNLSDQLVGAAVYYQVDHHQHVQKKHQVFDLLKKLDRGDDEVIGEGSTTFKQVKELMRHIWKQVKTPQQVEKEEEQASFGVLQFDGMIPSSTAATVGSNETADLSQLADELPVENGIKQAELPVGNNVKEAAEENKQEAIEKPASNDAVEKTEKEEKPKEETEEKNDSWGPKPTEEKKEGDSWETQAKEQANSWNTEESAAEKKPEEKKVESEPAEAKSEETKEESETKQEEPKEEEKKEEDSGSWDEKPKESKPKQQFDSWDNVDKNTSTKQKDADSHGWTKSFDNNVQADKWDNADSPNMPESNTKQSSIEEKKVKSPKFESTETESRSANDDWRRRDSESHEGSRGRGRGRGSGNYRGRGNGERGRVRGYFNNQRGGRGGFSTNGGSRGRGGRGRGRGRPSDHEHGNSTQQAAVPAATSSSSQ